VLRIETRARTHAHAFTRALSGVLALLRRMSIGGAQLAVNATVPPFGAIDGLVLERIERDVAAFGGVILLVASGGAALAAVDSADAQRARLTLLRRFASTTTIELDASLVLTDAASDVVVDDDDGDGDGGGGGAFDTNADVLAFNDSLADAMRQHEALHFVVGRARCVRFGVLPAGLTVRAQFYDRISLRTAQRLRLSSPERLHFCPVNGRRRCRAWSRSLLSCRGSRSCSRSARSRRFVAWISSRTKFRYCCLATGSTAMMIAPTAMMRRLR
jgi:hypothetical protein